MTLTITFSDEQAEMLTARAAAEGLSLEEWLKSLATELSLETGTLQDAADIVLEEMRNVQPEVNASYAQ